LKKGDKKHLILGHAAINHPYASIIRLLTSEIANLSSASYGYVTQGANTAGANLMGIHPIRDLAGKPRSEIGRNTQEIVSAENDLLLLLNAEPVRDIPALDAASNKSKFVIALTTHATENHMEVADLLLPIGSFAETSGTYINCEDRWQSFSGVSNPVGESRPAWKVLRAIGSLLELKAFEYDSSESILEEVTTKLQNMTSTNGVAKYSIQMELGKQDVLGEQSTEATPMYETDMVLRHATSLQLTPEAARSSSK
jgi:NADH-quinone oxidoreductase subunit G